jgi:hypothetical protein
MFAQQHDPRGTAFIDDLDRSRIACGKQPGLDSILLG